MSTQPLVRRSTRHANKPPPLTEEPEPPKKTKKAASSNTKKVKPTPKPSASSSKNGKGKKATKPAVQTPKAERPTHSRQLRSQKKGDELYPIDEEPEEQEAATLNNDDAQMEAEDGMDDGMEADIQAASQALAVVEEHVPKAHQDNLVQEHVPKAHQDNLVPDHDIAHAPEDLLQDYTLPDVPDRDIFRLEKEQDTLVEPNPQVTVPEQEVTEDVPQDDTAPEPDLLHPPAVDNAQATRRSLTPFPDDEGINMPKGPECDVDPFDVNYSNEGLQDYMDLDEQPQNNSEEDAEPAEEQLEIRPVPGQMRRAMQSVLDRLAEERKRDDDPTGFEDEGKNNDVHTQANTARVQNALASLVAPKKLDLNVALQQSYRRHRERERRQPAVPPMPIHASSPARQSSPFSSCQQIRSGSKPKAWVDREVAYRDWHARGPGEHLGMQPSPATRVLRERTRAAAAVGDHDDDGGSTSDYSTTEAETRAHLKKHAPSAVDYEEQDEEDFEAMEAETNRSAKGKSKAIEPDEEEEGDVQSEEEDGHEEGDVQSEEEDVDTAVAWDLKPGPLGQEDLQKAHEAHRAYHQSIEDIARGAGKAFNPWNAFQVNYRIDHPKPKEMDAHQYKTQCKNAYAALFEDLSEDDEDARHEIKSGLLAWYAKITAVMVETKKADGHSAAVMDKVVQPFIRQSTLTHQTKDVDVFSFAVDSFTGKAVIWGGSPDFFNLYATYKTAIQSKLQDFSAIMVKMARRDAEAVGTQPVLVDFTKRDKDKSRDVFRRTIGKLFQTALVRLVFREHDEEPPAVLMDKFSWQWADVAVTHHLRFKNWPIELKTSHRHKGFSLKLIKGEVLLQPWQKLWEAMAAKYRRDAAGEDGEEEEEDDEHDDPVEIESWMEEEMQLEGAALAKVPIIRALDGAVLLYAKDAPKLIRTLGVIDVSDEEDGDNDADEEEDNNDAVAEEEPSRPPKSRGRVRNDEEEGEENEEENEAQRAPLPRARSLREQRAGNTTAQPSRKRTAAAPPDEEPTPKRPATGSAAPAPSTSRLTLSMHTNEIWQSSPVSRRTEPTGTMMCRWVNGTQCSKGFPVDDVCPVDTGKVVTAAQYVSVQVYNGEEWLPLPPGLEPVLTDAQRRVADFYRKLVKA
ncbi:hypothetical protein FB45DRAFT_1029759 [Roridomyces roridus]|uniref:Uncharacterized protein n=1 Tax=Roridomyces roridus TaxID=1738132 RepID=A0AAD7BQK0_9AGAR|nr:hypothetical protein FB45DRAFT_1029759 [Roridomyces roridus]